MAHYNLQKIPQNFMEDKNEEMNQLINVLNTNPVSQELIDKIYSQFCGIVKNEMEDKLPRRWPGSHKQPFHKPWWNQELKEARKLVAKAEKSGWNVVTGLPDHFYKHNIEKWDENLTPWLERLRENGQTRLGGYWIHLYWEAHKHFGNN